jgi:phosphomannomutase
MNYVFDVDGTLTPSRGVIDKGFSDWFLMFAKTHNVFLVTGSDYQKTLEQLGKDICESVIRVYNCSGNAVYEKGILVKQSSFKISEELNKFLIETLNKHQYHTKTGLHIEERIGTCNFSIVGRNASKNQRLEYVMFDKFNKDRQSIAEKINNMFPEVEAVVGGETGIDIYEKGKDKSQVSTELSPYIFFGDAIFPGGNDYTVAQKANMYYNVDGWEETFELLRRLTY